MVKDSFHSLSIESLENQRLVRTRRNPLERFGLHLVFRAEGKNLSLLSLQGPDTAFPIASRFAVEQHKDFDLLSKTHAGPPQRVFK